MPKITAGQWTMSSQNGDLTGQKIPSPVLFTEHCLCVCRYMFGRSVQQVKPAKQVTTTIKSRFNQVNPSCKRKISGKFFIDKHLNQGTWHCLIPPFLEEIVKPGILNPHWEADDMCIITAHRPINNHT